MKKTTVKKTSAAQNTDDIRFHLKVWCCESFRKDRIMVAPTRATYYTFTNFPDAQAVADFNRLLGDVVRFSRLSGNPLLACERALKACRLADACYELHAAKLIPVSG